MALMEIEGLSIDLSRPGLQSGKVEGLSDRNVPRKPRLVGGVEGHNMNEISFPGSPALWAGSFTIAPFSNIPNFPEEPDRFRLRQKIKGKGPESHST
jgi:hypothetical protein